MLSYSSVHFTANLYSSILSLYNVNLPLHTGLSKEHGIKHMQSTKISVIFTTFSGSPPRFRSWVWHSEYPTQSQFETTYEFVPIFQVICFYWWINCSVLPLLPPLVLSTIISKRFYILVFFLWVKNLNYTLSAVAQTQYTDFNYFCN